MTAKKPKRPKPRETEVIYMRVPAVVHAQIATIASESEWPRSISSVAGELVTIGLAAKAAESAGAVKSTQTNDV